MDINKINKVYKEHVISILGRGGGYITQAERDKAKKRHRKKHRTRH